MTVLEKIQKLTDKQNGMGISKTIIGKYCGRNYNTINYYLQGAQPRPEVIKQYEDGLKKLLNDIQDIVEA